MALTFGKKLFLSLLTVGIMSAACASARAQYQIKSWSTDDGLPQNTVYSIVQTPDGYLWLATLDGLVRFDGARFTIFNKRNTDGINSNRFTQMVVDKDGALWAGTESDGITRYLNGRFQTFPNIVEANGRPLWRLVLNDKGELVVFTAAQILRWNGEQFVGYQPVAGENTGSVVLWGKSGTFWYADDDTVYRFKNERIDKFRLPGAGEGKGSTFTVELPLVKSCQAKESVSAAGNVERHDTSEAKILANVKLLIVDDDADALDLLRFVLEQKGAQAVCAGSVGKALTHLQDDKFDLLISDLGMAGTDGYDLIRQVRASENEDIAALPAIALTGYVSAEDRERVLLAGFQKHLSKPLDIDKLFAVVRDLIEENVKKSV